MLVGHKYNQTPKGGYRKSVYEVEYELLHEFNSSDNANLELEYSTNKAANYGRQAISRYIKSNKMPLVAWQKDKWVYVERKAICTDSQER